MGNNQELVLSINELLFLASEAGAPEFFGVGDPFFYMSVEQIRSTFENAAAYLDKKGYVEMDFEGNIRISEEVLALIRPCAFCSAYLTIENGSSKEREIYYFAEDILVKLWKCEDGWHLKRANREEELTNLCNRYDSDVYNIMTPKMKVSSKQLKKLKKAVINQEDEEQKQILESLESDEMRTVLLDIVSEEAEITSVIRSDFVSETVCSLLYINTEHGAILVSESDEKWTDDWYLEQASQERMKSELERMLVGISA